MEPKIIGKKIMWEGKFLQGVRIKYLNHEGVEKIWEGVERKKRKVASMILFDRTEDHFILIEQYRPPIAKESAQSLLFDFLEAMDIFRQKLPILTQNRMFESLKEMLSAKAKQMLEEDQRLALINDGIVIGLASGVCDDDKYTEEQTAVNESIEETGWKPQAVVTVGRGEPVSPGMQNELQYTFFGTDLIFVGKKKGPEEDGIKVHYVPRSRIFEWIQEQRVQGKLIDAKARGNIALALILIGEMEGKERQKNE